MVRSRRSPFVLSFYLKHLQTRSLKGTGLPNFPFFRLPQNGWIFSLLLSFFFLNPGAFPLSAVFRSPFTWSACVLTSVLFFSRTSLRAYIAFLYLLAHTKPKIFHFSSRQRNKVDAPKKRDMYEYNTPRNAAYRMFCWKRRRKCLHAGAPFHEDPKNAGYISTPHWAGLVKASG